MHGSWVQSLVGGTKIWNATWHGQKKNFFLRKIIGEYEMRRILLVRAVRVSVFCTASLSGHWRATVKAHLILLYFIVFCRNCNVYKLKVYGNFAASKSVGAIFPTAFATSCLCVTFWQFSRYFKFFLSQWSIFKTKVCEWKLLSCVWLFATSWTIKFMEFSRLEYWSG